MNENFNTIEEISLYISKLSIKQRTYKHIFDLMKNLSSLDQLINEGYTKDDIAFAIKRNIKLEHHYCPVCGNKIHVYKLLRYPNTCSVSCGVKNSQNLRKNFLRKDMASIIQVSYRKIKINIKKLCLNAMADIHFNQKN